MSPTISDEDSHLIKSNPVYNDRIFDKSIIWKNTQIDSVVSGMLYKTHLTKLNEHSIFKSINYKISIINNKIISLSDKLILKKSQEILKSMDTAKHSVESHHYLHSIKKYFVEDEDTESSSDDCYSQIETNYNSGLESSQKVLNKYQTWLVDRCQFQAKWSWLISEIQSTEFRLKHLKKYSEEIKHLKRKYSIKNDLNTEENSRNKYSRLEKRKRVQIHNLLSADLIKFVSPLYSSDDNSSDKFVQCKCRLGDIGPCILCCGMKNKILELPSDSYDKEEIFKASVLDNCIHTKLSNINDVRNQMKRNVLFNGYVKNVVPHWSYPRNRTSMSPILSPPSLIKIDNINKMEPIQLEFSGINIDKKEYKMDFTNDYFSKTENDVIDQTNNIKVEIKLPFWKKVESHLMISSAHNLNITQPEKLYLIGLIEDMDDEVFIKRHEFEETLERRRNYPLIKTTNCQTNSFEKSHSFHGFDYKQNSEDSYDLRLFPLLSDEFKQLTNLNKSYFHRSKRFKKRINKS